MDKKEQERREAIVDWLMEAKHELDPMTRGDARLVIDVAASIWEDAQKLIQNKAAALPPGLVTLFMTASLQELMGGASVALEGFVAEIQAEGGDVIQRMPDGSTVRNPLDTGSDLRLPPNGDCDCPVCEYRRALHDGEDMTAHPITAELLSKGYEVIAEADGALVLQRTGKPSKDKLH